MRQTLALLLAATTDMLSTLMERKLTNSGRKATITVASQLQGLTLTCT